ncbi:hypothetical protein LY76DRAFT_594788 [Colletotrichum caudatum]|nr:hypothetical protein LY76DRAFT_594788 [Colletotrichum caudatum]
MGDMCVSASARCLPKSNVPGMPNIAVVLTVLLAAAAAARLLVRRRRLCMYL